MLPTLMLLALVLPALAPRAGLAAQSPPTSVGTARISEEVITLSTYPFSEPNPVPILSRDARLYPYHSFDGYSTTPEPREWNVVRLENDFIEVYVLPEAGGKVWGAVVKETGHEFIYRNEVMKFRNIALRGPWTSGGIEFNFGVIGHTPATATPVDYVIRENPDGSVSCWVGGMDLPSRTHWRVEIRLPADKAYFETNVLWYNPTPLQQPYYNWMTAAAFAQDDLEMFIPGDAYLTHPGAERSWPFDDQDRYLPLYDNNRFDGNKSYHVVGELNDFFGGYFHDEDYGFGHWARYEDMPGQKLWLWALSRAGGVWEELLTDTDGQYIELQAGRLLVQYQPGDEKNPITQAAFDPMSASRWTETWFPLEETGGLTDASRDGAMHISREGDQLTIKVNAFGAVDDTLKVWSGDEPVTAVPVSLAVLDPYQTTVEVTAGNPFRVQLRGLGLNYDSDPSERLLSRRFLTDPRAVVDTPEADRMVFEAKELLKGRRHAQARALFSSALDHEPWNREAHLGLADLDYRAGLNVPGLEHVNRVLQLDAYDADANFMAGTLYRATERTADAREAFGWAARSVAYRSAAYAQLAEIMIGEREFAEAARYARLAVDYDRYSVPAWRALAIVGRQTEDAALAEEAQSELSALDPLHHFVWAENYLASRSNASARAGAQILAGALGGEYPEQTLLEMAIGYLNVGLGGDALTLLEVDLARAGEDAPQGTAGSDVLRTTTLDAGNRGLLHRGWLALLRGDPASLDSVEDPDFQFPFRRETLSMLEWAAQNSDAWQWDYLVALNLWAVDRGVEAGSRLRAIGNEPNFGPFYVARGHLLDQVLGVDPTEDFRRAVATDPESWPLQIQLIRRLEQDGRWSEALAALDVARERFPDEFNLDLFMAQALINVGRAQEATEILAATHVLPSENARGSHGLHVQAHTLVAFDAMDAEDYGEARTHLLTALEWPELLGQGKPYEPEERLVRLLLAKTEAHLGHDGAARESFQMVVEASADVARWGDLRAISTEPGFSRLDLLAVPALRAMDQGEALRAVGWTAGDMSEITRLLVAEVPELFDDLEGRMILRAMRQE